MKKVFLLFILAGTLKAYSQDTAQIKQIDLLVNAIKNSNLSSQTDSTLVDVPGFSMKTYITTLRDSGLRKYTIYSKGKQTVDNVSKEIIMSYSLYFDQNKLIKGEEFTMEDGKENKADWYFRNDKVIFYTPELELPDERTKFWLEFAKNVLATIKNN